MSHLVIFNPRNAKVVILSENPTIPQATVITESDLYDYPQLSMIEPTTVRNIYLEPTASWRSGPSGMYDPSIAEFSEVIANDDILFCCLANDAGLLRLGRNMNGAPALTLARGSHVLASYFMPAYYAAEMERPGTFLYSQQLTAFVPMYPPSTRQTIFGAYYHILRHAVLDDPTVTGAFPAQFRSRLPSVRVRRSSPVDLRLSFEPDPRNYHINVGAVGYGKVQF